MTAPAKKLTIETWIALHYASGGPTVSTVRRWCREGLLYPAPAKEGRSYYLHPDSRYTAAKPTLVQRLHASSITEPQTAAA